METKQDWDGALLIPTTDLSVAFVSQNRVTLADRYVTAVQSWDIVNELLDKRSLYLHAQELGVPTPGIFFPDSVQSLARTKDGLRYPCILKPVESQKFVERFGTKVIIVHDSEELIAQYMETQRHALDMMVSEIIPGDDSQFFHYRSYIDSQGDVLAEMCTQKLQQVPPDFGVARVSRTVPMIEDIRQLTLKLLRSVSYSGVSSAEYKFDSRDNEFKLIEINVRPVVPERLFVAAGINFPHITYLDLVENVRRRAPTYDPDIYWIDQFGEFYELAKMLARKRFAVRNYFWPYRNKTKVFCISFLNDPMPFIVRSVEQLGLVSKGLINRSRWR